MDGGLTDKLEIEQKYEADADFTMPDLSGLGGAEMASPPDVQLLVARYYDTSDLRLAAAGVTLRRRTGGADAAWHLKLPVGGHTRHEVHAPLESGDEAVPPDGGEKPVPPGLAKLVTAWTQGRPLQPVATLETRRTVWPITGPGGEVLAEVADDLVTGHRDALPGPSGSPGLGPADLTWREVEVELVSGSPAILAAAAQRLHGAGARPSGSANKLSRVLAAPAAEA